MHGAWFNVFPLIAKELSVTLCRQLAGKRILALLKIQKNRSILRFARRIIHEFPSMSGALIGNYNVFLVRVRKLACTMQRRLIYGLLKVWGTEKEGRTRYFDITFRQRRLNRCHKSIPRMHIAIYATQWDRALGNIYWTVKITAYHAKVINSPPGRTIQRAGGGPWISLPFLNFRCTQSSFIFSNAFMDVSPFPKCISTYVQDCSISCSSTSNISDLWPRYEQNTHESSTIGDNDDKIRRTIFFNLSDQILQSYFR